ncbi:MULTISPECIES: hypothetical protein [unclassified Streptomyces]|uniref:hypothetical protein n=1 Tax=unclassified Streptomyces TaxID=2593676 RepID=UPI002E294EDA|nr:hypothetical protein [Streptomyces sp. NBC_01439]
MTDGEKAEVPGEAIGAYYLAEVAADDLDSDDLSWTLVDALRRAGAVRSPA